MALWPKLVFVVVLLARTDNNKDFCLEMLYYLLLY